MQDVSPWPSSFDVSEPVARVLVDGTEVEVESVEVSSELGSAMPERVVAGGGIVAATGSVSVLRSDEVTEAGFNPWGDAQSFVSASEVVVEAGYRDPETGNVGCVRQMTGQVESLGGSAQQSHVGMDFVDHTPTLDRDITIEPLLTRYPPLEDWAPYRLAGLSPIYIRDRVLRHCGFYATPTMLSQAILSAPLMGSAIPERGTFLAGEPDVLGETLFRPTPWGVGTTNSVFRFAPTVGSRGHTRLTSTLHVSFLRAQSPESNPSNAHIELRWGVRHHIRISVLGNGQVSVLFRSEQPYATVARLYPADVNASEAFTVLISSAGDVSIYASNGAVATGSAPVPSLAASQNMDEVVVDAGLGSHRIGGLQVAFSADTTIGFQRNAHLDSPVRMHSLEAFPFQDKVNCLSLLKEQANAEMSAMWIDEFGHFRWRNRVRLRSTQPVGTLTSKHHLLDLSWDIPVRSVFSRVDIEHDVPVVTRRYTPSITVSDNRGSTLSNGDTEDRFFEPPANQDWHQVDAPQWMGGTIDYGELRRGRGSYRGGIIVDDDDTERLAYSNRLSSVWSQINPQRWLLSSAASGLTGTEFIEQAFRGRPDLYGRFAGENLPVIRARGLVEWQNETTTGAARGPALAPVFTHNVGAWVQGGPELLEVVNWLAEQLTKPEPVLRRVPIVPDPRIQLGDSFWLEDQTAYNVRLRVVVMGKTLRYQATSSGYEMTQEITCRVIDVQRTTARYDELETAWANRDYAALAAAWTGQDYAALEAAPLDRS